jgi:succinyl-diaminopimelate desuccinylase
MIPYDGHMPFSDEVSLAQALIQARSPSGRESAAAQVFEAALASLGYACSRDAAGNVIGRLECGSGPTLMFNGHLDTVPEGDEALWPYPPLSGGIAEDRLWGRGACDMKSALACMAWAGRDALERGFSGTLLVTGVVQEEVGGLGARHLSEHTRADLIILGEPSKLRLMLGHRGRVEIHAHVPGRIAHAAKNELGDNALYRAARLLQVLETLELPSGGPLKGSSLTPTQLVSFPKGGANVVPGRADLTIDYRSVPGDEPEAILERLRAVAPEVTFSVPFENAVSESGEVQYRFPRIAPPYLAPLDDPRVAQARETLQAVLPGEGVTFGEDCWWFATDAPYLAQGGTLVLGFGPGEEELAHTTRESVPLEHLRVARKGYAALAHRFLEVGMKPEGEHEREPKHER